MCVLFIFIIYYFHCLLVQRVHWLRARAQRMRWQEEVTLTTYEMQWTVKFFTYNAEMWKRFQDTEADFSNVGAGATAYARRKQATWDQLCLQSDRTFKSLNNAYKSPM
jgi:hypothetical protein